MKNKISSKLLNGFIICGIILTLLALIATPISFTALKKVTSFKSDFGAIEWIVSGFVYACAVPYLIALFKFRKIGRLLTSENSFSPMLAKEARGIALCAFAEAILYIVCNLLLIVGYHVYFYAGTLIPMVIIPFVAVTAGLFFLALSDMFKRAAVIKEEYDLTL